MKRYSLLFLLILSGLAGFAQKTIYDANAEKRTVTPFKAIHVSGGIDLYVSYGEEAVAVSARDAETRDLIRTEVKDGVLKIWYEWKEGKNVRINRQLKAYVSYKTLEALSGSGGSDITVDGTINSSRLQINISGGADFTGKVDSDELNVGASGGSDVDISGRASRFTANVSGGSDVNGYELFTETATLEASGGSDITLTVNKSLTANASGGSDITYKGSATTVQANKSGGSDVRKS